MMKEFNDEKHEINIKENNNNPHLYEFIRVAVYRKEILTYFSFILQNHSFFILITIYFIFYIISFSI